MPTPTYVALAKTVLTGTQATVTFSSIASTYTDLVVLINARGDDATDISTMYVRINGDTGANYSYTRLFSFGTAVNSDRAGNQSNFASAGFYNASTSTSNTFSNVEFYLPSYTASIKKIISSSSAVEINSTSSGVNGAGASLYGSTTAISSLTIVNNSGNFVSGSRFDLYGIKNS